MYAPDAVFWHPFCTMKGSKDIAGYFQAWATLNRKLDVRVFGFSAGPCPLPLLITLVGLSEGTVPA